MEIKIVCGCGAKFAFDVEPVEGRMPYPISCPECNADRTVLANDVISSKLGGGIPLAIALPSNEVDAQPAAESNPGAAPIPNSPPLNVPTDRGGEQTVTRPNLSPPVSKPKAAAGAALGLTLSPPGSKTKPQAAPMPAPAATSGPRTAPPVFAATPPAPITPAEQLEEDAGVVDAVPEPETKPKKKKKRRKKKTTKKVSGVNFPLGMIGGFFGAVIGTVIWYCLARYANMNFGIIAWVIGGLVGFGTKLGAGEDNDFVAICSAAMALFSILIGQYLAIAALIQSGRQMADLDLFYEIHQEMAKEIVAAKTDRELTQVLNEMYDEEFTPADIKDYKERDLPFMQRMANGSATKNEFRKYMRNRFDVWEEFKTSFGIRMYIWIFFGIGTAYRIPGGGTED